MRGVSSAVDTVDRGEVASLVLRALVDPVSLKLRLGLDCIVLRGLAVLAVPNALGLTVVSVGLTEVSLVGVSKLLFPTLPLLTVSPKSKPEKLPANPSTIGLAASRARSSSTSMAKLCRRGVWNVRVSRLA